MITLLDAVTATGVGGRASRQSVITDSTYTVTVTGAPSSVIVDIEGSADGISFSQFAQHTVSGATDIFHIAGKPANFLRGNLTTLTGGTTPTVTVEVLFGD